MEQNADGTFAQPRLIAETRHTVASEVAVADLDFDGDLDILIASDVYNDELFVFRQRVVGDANDDGVFDSSDLVLVFQSGEYEDGDRENSTFSEGDWNGDLEFTTADLVLAFQVGNFSQNAVANQTQREDPMIVDIASALERDEKKFRAALASERQP